MKFIKIIILLDILVLVLNILQFEQGTNRQYDVSYGSHLKRDVHIFPRNTDRIISFSNSFSSVPQVLLSITRLDCEFGYPVGYDLQIVPDSITKTNFSVRVTEYVGRSVGTVSFSWVALVDHNVQIIHSYQMNTNNQPGQQTLITLNYELNLECDGGITAAVFLLGGQISGGSNELSIRVHDSSRNDQIVISAQTTRSNVEWISFNTISSCSNNMEAFRVGRLLDDSERINWNNGVGSRDQDFSVLLNHPEYYQQGFLISGFQLFAYRNRFDDYQPSQRYLYFQQTQCDFCQIYRFNAKDLIVEDNHFKASLGTWFYNRIEGIFVQGIIYKEATCYQHCETCNNPNNCITCSNPNNVPPYCCPSIQGQYCEGDSKDRAVYKNCDYKCKTCIESSEKCLECSHQTRENEPSCNCKQGYYNVGTSPECQMCSYKCKECSLSSTQCNSCSHHTRVGTTCECDGGYYNFQQEKECRKCIHPCNNCENQSKCSSCVGNNRILLGLNCSCGQGFFEDGSDDCQKCSYKCLKCEIQSEQCTECSHSTRGGIHCDCLDGYYNQDNQEECKPCVHPCANCTGSNQCSSCVGKYREMSDQSCSCIFGYFETGENDCQGILQIYKNNFLNHKNPQNARTNVEVCQNKADECLECVHETRQGQNCHCKPGFYDNGDEECQPCQYPCQTCFSLTQCNSCVGQNREVQTQSCQCSRGYYSNGEADCLKCDSSCKTCETSSTNCVRCKSGIGRPIQGPNCACKKQYVQIPGFDDCMKCNPKCSSCITTTDTCIECTNKEFLPPLCEDKKDGYLTIKNDDKNLIQKCDTKCKTCTKSKDQCTQCAKGINRNSLAPQCECLEEFHDYGGLLIDCIGRCSIFLLKNGKYSTSYFILLKNIQLTIYLSIDNDKCVECKLGLFRTINKFSGKCECSQGYYENVNQICKKCVYYKGKCFGECPKNTHINKDKNACYDIAYSIENHTLIIILSSITSLVIVGFILVCLHKFRLDQKNNNIRTSKYNNANNKKSIHISSEEQSYSYECDMQYKNEQATDQ